MTSNLDISWLQFYEAAKYGYTSVVRAALSNHDFRVWLENTRSALDLGAMYGRTRVVDAILSSEQMKTYTDIEQTRILMSAMKYSCERAQLETTTMLVTKLKIVMKDLKSETERNFVNDDAFSKLISSALAPKSGNLEIVKLLGENFKTPFLNEHLVKAFNYGHRDIFKYILAETNDNLQYLYSLGVPKLFIKIAAGDIDSVKELTIDIDDWYEAVDYSIGWETKLNAFEVASIFCDTDILEVLFQRASELALGVLDLSAAKKSVIRRIGKHDLKIIRWLDAKGKIDWKDDEKYSIVSYHSGRSKEAFMYACNRLINLLEADSKSYNINSIHLAISGGCREACGAEYTDTDIVRFCVKLFGGDVGFINDASSYDIPDALEVVTRAIEQFSCMERGRNNLDEALKSALRSCEYKKQKLPSPATLEVLLNWLPRGSCCPCGDVILLDLFLNWQPGYLEFEEERQGRLKFMDNFTEFNDIMNHVKIYFQLLGRHGALPRQKTADEVCKVLFKDNPRTYQVARALWLIDWLGLEFVFSYYFITMRHSIWGDDILMGDYEYRDLMITYVLKSLSGCNRMIQTWTGGVNQVPWKWTGFLVYILSPKSRREHFTRCIDKLGIGIEDDYLDKCPEHIKATDAFKELENRKKAKFQSLQIRARMSIHQYLRQQCDFYLKQGVDFLPLSIMVRKFCDAHNPPLPKGVRRYLEFEDLFEGWDGRNFDGGVNVLKEMMERMRREDINR